VKREVPLGWPAFLATTLVLVGAIALHAAWLPMPLRLGLAAIVALRVAWRRMRPGRVPAVLRLALVAALVAVVYASLGNLLGREAGSASLAAMLALKLLETDTRRDARVVVTISCFLAMCSFLFEQSPVQAVFAMIVVVFAMATLLQLSSLASRDLSDRRWRPLPGATLAGAGRLALWSAPFAAACFLLFPRLAAPLWGAPGDAFAGRTGISDTMEPGGLSSLALDDSPAMRVTFDGPVPPPEDRYFRGLVFWWFDGRTWSGPGAYVGFRASPQIEPRGEVIEYEVMLEPTDQRWLFLLDAPLSPPQGAGLAADFQVRVAEAVRDVKAYRGSSATRYVMQRDMTSTQRYMALSLPPDGNPRARALAASWRDAGLAPREIAGRALDLFNLSFTYTLEPPLLARDSVDDFLFETREGYCEHYASAFTFLMRAAGVPARVVVGYHGGYLNSAGGYLVVRRADAHAWSEIWIAGEGWVRIDPTSAVAPERIAEDARAAFAGIGERGWWSALRENLDLAGYWWNQAVVQFSALKQERLLQDFGVDRATPAQLVGLLVVAGALALGLAAWALSTRVRRVRADGPLAAWRRLCARLARLGVPRHGNEGPRDFAARAGTALPEFAPAIASVSERFVALRYAAVNDDAALAGGAAFAREARELERALARRYGRRRRP
jgi:transglutaminase-like putative cysteine protease